MKQANLRRIALGLLGALTLVSTAAPAQQPATAPLSDAGFMEALEQGGTLDTQRLARIFFGLAAALEGGKSTVRMLQSKIIVPTGERQAVQSLLARRFAEYEQALDRFRGSASSLLDDPDSRLRFYRLLSDGQRACWQLDLHNRLIDSYGGADLMSILSSREACSKFRNAAFQPVVEALVQQALQDDEDQRQQILALSEELEVLEQLVEDLRRIDAAD